MKLPALLLAGSLFANVAFVAAFALQPDRAPSAFRDFFPRKSAVSDTASLSAREGAASAGKKAIRVEAQRAQLWASLRSDDLRTLVSRLREAGFSTVAIRAVVDAQIENQFRERMNALVGSVADTPFWKPEPMSSMNNPRFFEEYNQIYRDRSKLLRQVLGDDIFAGTGTDPSVAQRRQYGDIPRQKIDLIERINADYAEMNSQVRSATQGIMLPEDREKVALLEREKRADLAAILTPQELADYEMRTSPVTSRLRSALTLMDANEDEFRTIFGIQQRYNDQINPTTLNLGIITSESMQQRSAAMMKAATEIKAALGDARYAEYARAASNEFQQLTRLGQRENIPNDVLVRTYNLRDTVAAESARIAADTTLSPEEKRAAAQALGQNARAQITGALGSTAAEGYIRSANWVAMLERGMGVTVNVDGSITTRPLNLPPTTTKKP